MSDSTIRALAREIASLKRQVRDMEVASQGAHRSVEEGAIDFYDENGVLRERIGRFADDTYGRRSYGGDPPPAPTEPDVVTLVDGLVAVTWDGRFEERYSGEFRNVQVHLGPTATFTPDRTTQEGAIFARRGGTIVCVTESDTDNPVYVRLVASSRAGVTSEPSVAVLVDEDDPDDFEEAPEELTFEAHDVHVVTAAEVTAGVAVQKLSRWPMVESIDARWGQLPQEPTEYTVDYEAKTITWPLVGTAKPIANDRLWVHYTYYAVGESVDIPFASAGWRYLPITRADVVDRSAIGFDDSSWSVGAGAFGTSAPSGSGWPAPSTAWGPEAGIWLRRAIPAMTGTLRITVRADAYVDVYWNGVQVYDLSSGEFYTTFSVDVDGDPAQENVLAVRAEDAAAPSYIDVAIVSV